MTKHLTLENVSIVAISLALIALAFVFGIHLVTVLLGPIPFEAALIFGTFIALPLVVMEHAIWELLTLYLRDRASKTASLPGESVCEQVSTT